MHWEAAMQPPSDHAHVQLSPAMGWSRAGGQAASWGYSAWERFGLTLLLPPQIWCVGAIGHQWQMDPTQHHLWHSQREMMPPFHCFCAQDGSRRHFRSGARQL